MARSVYQLQVRGQVTDKVSWTIQKLVVGGEGHRWPGLPTELTHSALEFHSHVSIALRVIEGIQELQAGNDL